MDCSNPTKYAITPVLYYPWQVTLLCNTSEKYKDLILLFFILKVLKSAAGQVDIYVI